MNDLTPLPPSDSGFQLMETMANNHAPPASKFRLQKFLYFLRKFWWIPLITLIVSGGIATGLFFKVPPIFVSSGSLWETEKLRLPDGADFTDDRDNYLGTQDELLRSKMLADLTLTRMRALATNQIALDKDGNPLPVEIQVFASQKSSVYTVEARSANPAYTPAYLNALMQSYLDYRKNIRREVSGDTLASISEQVQRLERDMKAGQDTLTAYEQSNNLPIVEQENSAGAAYLGNLKTQLSEYELQIRLLSVTEKEASSSRAGGTNTSDTVMDLLNNSDSPVSLAAPRLDAEKQIELLNQQRARLPKDLATNAPKVVELNDEIVQAQNLIDFYRQQDLEQHAAIRDALEIKIDTIQQSIKEWEDKLAKYNTLIGTAEGLKQNITRNQGMFDRLSALLQNVDISRNIDQETLAILEPASSVTRSYKEAETKIAQSGFLGFGLGLGIVFLLTLRDDRFNSMVEVTERFGDYVVGQVPETPIISGTEPPLLVENDERHMYAESYRNLRSALLYLGVDGRRPKVVLITSAVPDEGKSTIATNLARTMALGGSKVLLVDGDLRKGHIHQLLQLQSKPGLSDWLREPDGSGQFIQTTDIPKFSFLSRGGNIRNPGDLFLSPAFDQILERVREHFDYVLIDSCPVFAADDTTTIAPKVDGALFVVRSRFSHARMVREALELLFQRQARILGLILNRTDSSVRSYYHYKYAKYYHSEDNVEVNKDS
jgi:polysaccharide biosynthesis transport protein